MEFKDYLESEAENDEHTEDEKTFIHDMIELLDEREENGEDMRFPAIQQSIIDDRSDEEALRYGRLYVRFLESRLE